MWAACRGNSPVAALFLCALLLVPPNGARALDCESPATTVDMIKCADLDYQHADKQLNEVYTEMHAAMDETARKLLRDSQRAWIAFRDAECKRARDVARGGTMAPILQLTCLADLTEQRIGDLKGE